MPDPGGADGRLAVFFADRFALVQFHGRADGGDVLRLGEAVAHHPDWRPGFTEVWDIRAATVSVTPAEIKALGEAEKAWGDLLAGSLTIVVVDRPMIRYALDFYARLLAPLDRRLEVCQTARAAADRLGIDALPTLPPDAQLAG